MYLLTLLIRMSRLEMLRIPRSRCSSENARASLACKHASCLCRFLTLLIHAKKHGVFR